MGIKAGKSKEEDDFWEGRFSGNYCRGLRG